ncbi:MAG: aspartate--tRNA ligase [Candidatus Omnitrophica bacterium]|nr:aspartate--tRNA ligase [Candidatus Omnitrophota bacterium]MCM8798779.1 aspartate--tRNA ligase [Candidatus Omnitrophota bacterium]
MVYRTHSCNELNLADVGKEVTLCGWVASRRDHGSLIFVDLRDRAGITQIVFHPQTNKEAYLQAKELRSEYLVQIRGKVQKRPPGTENPRLKTGEVEVAVSLLKILNPSLTPPFEVSDEWSNPPSEELRLTYRFLDLRRKSMQEILFVRHKVCKGMRDFLDRENFLEVETPMLTKSTPEGARDFLVPARLEPGSFYALPQSPQLFKQILMVSGLERYFQIVRCFRDEDLRADRQPEFTQLDIEMSFINEEDIFSLVERMFKFIWEEILGKRLNIPFPRLRYKEAMEKYRSDKPDLREKKEDFAFLWVIDFPLFKYDETEKRWDSEHHPFTAPCEEDIAHLESQPEKVKARSYDLVLNGVEIGSGSIRIHRRELQEKIFKVLGISPEEAEKRFGFLLRAFDYGAPPHGGIAFGIDRLISLILGRESIRDTIAFPKTQKGICPLTQAPDVVSERQLKELGIKIDKPKG